MVSVAWDPSLLLGSEEALGGLAYQISFASESGVATSCGSAKDPAQICEAKATLIRYNSEACNAVMGCYSSDIQARACWDYRVKTSVLASNGTTVFSKDICNANQVINWKLQEFDKVIFSLTYPNPGITDGGASDTLPRVACFLACGTSGPADASGITSTKFDTPGAAAMKVNASFWAQLVS